MNFLRTLLIAGLILTVQGQLPAQTPAPLQADFGEATLLKWVQPEYPAAARDAKLEGRVVIEFVVGLDGHVSQAQVKSSTDEKFNANALAAVQQWTFSPALADAKPVVSGMQVPVVFSLDQLRQRSVPLEPAQELLPVQLPVTPPQLSVSPDPEYPAELEDRQLPGRVILEFIVETDGTAHNPKILWSPHAAFVPEALRTLEKYRFEPAHQGPLPVKSGATQGEMEFGTVGADHPALLAANHITVVEPDKIQDVPRALVLAEPVYPLDRLLAGTEGSATVEFTVTETGATADLLRKESSEPEFGAALMAAVESWKFEAAMMGNQRVAARLVVTQKFTPPTSGPVNRLVQALQSGGTGIKGATGLDQRLHPIWRTRPGYPLDLRTDKPKGQTQIEFIIDTEGRVRLPRVVSASQEEFGWAAATAISQWVFAPPLRGGQPTDVKVSIPVEFAPPKD